MDPPDDLLSVLAEFRDRLEEAVGPVEHLVLFGSHARGDTHEWSDVDLLVVSPAFEGDTAVARAGRARRLWPIHFPVDILCYTPEEFERLRRQVSIVRVALDEGIDVAAA